jgi:divalent metal cation (Fe/Co/Zn/Cd) transporter
MAGNCRSELSRADAAASRGLLIRKAFALEWITIAWMILEAGAAIVAGLAAHSLSLVAFGIDSVIELMSAAVLLWRLAIELKRGREFPETVERAASRVGGALLFALAVYVVLAAGWALWQRQGEEFSVLGLIAAAAAIPIMWWLSRRKLAIAAALGSRALRADAMEAVACGYLSLTLVIGLLAQLALGAWWVDGVTSLAIVYFLVKEGREAWEATECCE